MSKMPNLTKSPKKRTEWLIGLKTYNTIKVKLILENAIGELNLMIAHEMKNLDDIEMKIVMQDGKIRFERINNSLHKFEKNALETEANVKNIKKYNRLFKKIKAWVIRSLYK